MAGYAGTTITTELIQKYLDENKQLILAILDNQNLGKLNECATYQAKLQKNLMYLAAIADAQPQAPASVTQPGQTYMQQQQQSMSGVRNSIPFNMSQSPAPTHQSQQSLHEQQGLVMGGGGGLRGMEDLIDNEPNMGGNGLTSSGEFSDYAQNVNAGGSGNGRIQTSSMGLGGADMSGAGGGPLDMAVSTGSMGPGSLAGDGASEAGHSADELESSYLKATDEEGN